MKKFDRWAEIARQCGVDLAEHTHYLLTEFGARFEDVIVNHDFAPRQRAGALKAIMYDAALDRWRCPNHSRN